MVDHEDDDEDQHETTMVLGMDPLGLQKSDEARNAYLIMISGRNVGRQHKIETKEIFLGRSPKANILIEDEGVSRLHARIERRLGSFYVNDNNSTNGIFVNGEKVMNHLLEDGDRLQIGSTTVLKFSYQDEVEEQFQRQLYESATRDALTGAFNKKYFADHLKSEFAYSIRHNTIMSLVLFDIDHFKKLNDGYGHLAGDFVLKNLSSVVMGVLRTEDVFARYGGEEFGIVLRGIEAEKAFLVAERVRRAIEGHEFMWEGVRLPVQISVGVSTFADKNMESPKEMVGTADKYLYKAKDGGRNRTESAAFG